MKKILLLIILLILLSGCGLEKPSSDLGTKNMPNLSSKKVLMVIAFKDYQDYEYEATKKVLGSARIQVVTASSRSGIARGNFGSSTQVDLALEQVNVSDYDAIIFIGGPGAVEYTESNLAHEIAREAVKQDKILGAICIAPTILAKAGVLVAKKATVWSSALERSTIDVLEENGAQYLDEDVVSDGKIITANGPEAAEKFGEKILELLNVSGD